MKPAPEDIFNISTEAGFNELALSVFYYQANKNAVYKRYIGTLGIEPLTVRDIKYIPFLPVEFFKNFEVVSGDKMPGAITFTSSGTTGMSVSKHVVNDVSIYEKSFRKAFEIFYGDIKDYAIFALLPSYLEREGSSLIYMADDLIKRSQNKQSKFYLNQHSDLLSSLEDREKSGRRSLLIGVSYALLDLIENKNLNLKNTIIMETGGMKGKRREMVREELHDILCKGFGVNNIHSEYGMTELLSQAYSRGNGIFECPPWMKIMIRDTNDPFTILEENKTGGVNIIDLANINSCSFIATQDLGRKYNDGSFEIMGRFDNSDIRGCNLLVQ